MAFDEKNGTETDVEWSGSSSYEGENEEIKRDLKSRHINMIAIAGMIVSLRPTVLLIAFTHENRGRVCF
jgi:amino acid permease